MRIAAHTAKDCPAVQFWTTSTSVSPLMACSAWPSPSPRSRGGDRTHAAGCLDLQALGEAAAGPRLPRPHRVLPAQGSPGAVDRPAAHRLRLATGRRWVRPGRLVQLHATHVRPPAGPAPGAESGHHTLLPWSDAHDSLGVMPASLCRPWQLLQRANRPVVCCRDWAGALEMRGALFFRQLS